MSEVPFLRVVHADDESSSPPPRSHLSAEMTLVQFFYRYAWPDCLAPKGDSRRTRKDYETSLRYWQELTGNPPLKKISKRTCSRFVNLLRALSVRCGDPNQKLSANTLHKHWVNIQRLITWTGPPGRNNPNGATLIEQPPWIAAPRKEYRPPKVGFNLEEVWRWLEVLPQVARRMPKIARLNPVAWWRALILLAYNTGMRPEALFGIRWEMVEGQRLMIVPAIAKGRRGHMLWLNRAAMAAIEPLKPNRPGGLILGWESWPAADSTLRKHRIIQQQAAGIRVLPLYALRRTFATQCAKINPLAAQIMMNHKGLGMQMMIEHYIDRDAVLSEALEKMPQPGRAVQQTLF